LIVACAGSPRPCRSPSACAEGSECLADRCLPLGAEPVAVDSRRVVLDPVALAVVRAGARPESALPPTVTFGGPRHENEQLLVAFADDWGAVDVDTAFLLLEPDVAAEPTADDVEIAVAVAAGEWRSGVAGELPASHGPNGNGVGRTRPPAALRIDVTALVREIAKQPRGSHGFVVRATGSSERGAVYSTGIDGPAPRLDVYFRQRPKAR
ncbi:MAG TPA: hypothetical protein VMG12_01820, partial [Polyangiaceae bacterium]|nr:hypothetical protein [Polyangiaceae bacterium]